VAVIATVAAGCGGSAAPDGAPPSDTYRVLRAGLCATLDHAEDREPGLASRAFYGRTHQGVHDLADATIEMDRVATARLLEAKQRVKASLERHDRDLPRDLRELIAATNAALGALGHPRLTCDNHDNQEHRP
jgi:hypothetical protein